MRARKVCQKQILLLSKQTFMTEVESFIVGLVRLAGKLRVAYMCQHALVAPAVRV
jgi:hypothetical protein